MQQYTSHIQEILTRGVTEIIDNNALVKKLQDTKPLRVKFGIDPTGADLHLGHTVNLWKLRQFQDAGHIAVLIIGDYTASIGDPSGKDTTRPHLTQEQIQENYQLYRQQALHILSEENLEVRHQSEWFADFSLHDIIKLTTSASVSEILSHETFRNRLSTHSPFSTHEILYPFLQGYDSVAVEADIELGAVEQKFNLLMGRTVQRAYGQEPQDVMMSPYLLGTDGKEKMSKSLDNYIGVNDEPRDMFGKVMSITDKEIVLYFEMVTRVSVEQLEAYKKQDISGHAARDLKMDLAYAITKTFHGEQKAQQAKDEFISVFQKGDTQKGATDVVLPQQEYALGDLLVQSGITTSKNEARRQVEQGSVYIDDNKQHDVFQRVTLSKDTPLVARVGKRSIVSVLWG